MRFDVISLFPRWFDSYKELGVVSRAFSKGVVRLNTWNPRDFTDTAYRNVDDRPFGGGPGMVMMAEPLERCIQAIKADVTNNAVEHEIKPRVIYLSPQGQTLNQKMVEQLAKLPALTLLCGRYEGVDQRLLDRCVDQEVSVGDYVLSGGEIAAAALIDAVVRLIPGVLNDQQSVQQDSFSADEDLLDCDHYTRPELYQGLFVPGVLLSGHHRLIDQWRHQSAIENTKRKRPDLWLKYQQKNESKK
jgi:tRNA (guanine37-N1)-methyltransferase